MHIVLIGAGIMSATLGVFLKQLMPGVRISLFEYLDKVAAESSDPLNNSGTGHAAYCELNYTPMTEGHVDISKALSISESFEISKQFWAYLRESGAVSYQVPFINTVPHMSFVWGDENTDFLQKRFGAMHKAPMFQDMSFTADPTKIQKWAPLIMEGRDTNQALAATKMDAGTDVNFGAIAEEMIRYLENLDSVEIHLEHRIVDFKKQADNRWKVQVEDIKQGIENEIDADYVFIGAGGASLSLLQKTGIEKAKGYGGFPISGQFLTCSNPDVVRKHTTKVYGKADVGAPPMSVPHLDARIIDGQKTLFFGPFAGFSTKFLKHGSYLDLPASLDLDNIWPLLTAGVQNMDLTQYLVKEVMLSAEDRFKALQAYYPNAEFEDWNLTVAGQRVQIIEKSESGDGLLKFGTEVISSDDGTVTALLGASPGASVSVSIMLGVIKHMFPEKMNDHAWQQLLKEMIPTYGESLLDNSELCLATRARTHAILELGL